MYKKMKINAIQYRPEIYFWKKVKLLINFNVRFSTKGMHGKLSKILFFFE